MAGMLAIHQFGNKMDHKAGSKFPENNQGDFMLDTILTRRAIAADEARYHGKI
jgi:hypothetical protein